ncbi:hypothetical protein HYX01_03610 [Candidatus Woesearchaeota archaeon]|nr:hypothetical protein [Candidatus Woesearchaeota archaeon]
MDLSSEAHKIEDRQTKKELFAAFDKLKDEINVLSRELDKSNNEKESWFKKKEDISSDIRKKIGDTVNDRNKKNSLIKQIKELKERRDSINKEIREKISLLAELKNSAKELSKKSKIDSPFSIKSEIDSIETRLETEVMPFEKEKELSKKLKARKKLLGSANAIIEVLDKIKKCNSEIDIARKSADSLHNEIQQLAQESQQMHENVIKSSKEIDELKLKEDGAFKNFVECKKVFTETNNNLKERLDDINKIREKLNKFKLEEDEKRRLKESMLIKNKEQEMEEKIKEGKKLTTDDLLLFQQMIRNKKSTVP